MLLLYYNLLPAKVQSTANSYGVQLTPPLITSFRRELGGH
jgi:hypothetical protein